MTTNSTNLALQREGRLLLALQAIQKGHIKTIRATAKAYNVSESTLRDRRNGRISRAKSTPNSRKLNTTEESILRN